ncbi:MAG: hypothetical protein KatS3mg057_2241 [Herpetosiphonaceae bacterium]|nr:MAG: hypothetical protein KatS3mg057_2241 [Herpetosiphonaceae bacterium]
MNETFFGIPWVILGGGALVVALIFTFVWPSRKVGAKPSVVRCVILRWFHAMVWALLSIVCFVRAMNISLQSQLTNVFLLAALGLYLTCVVTLVSSNRKPEPEGRRPEAGRPAVGPALVGLPRE